MDELKSCPFCGGEAEIKEHDDGSGGIWCKKCGFTPLIHAHFGKFINRTKQEAIVEWNRREYSERHNQKALTLEELTQRSEAKQTS